MTNDLPILIVDLDDGSVSIDPEALDLVPASSWDRLLARVLSEPAPQAPLPRRSEARR